MTPVAELCSGILLLGTDDPEAGGATADELRAWFSSWGIAITAYGDGRIRLSAPLSPLSGADQQRLQSALLL